MPKKKFLGTLYLRRSRLQKLGAVIDACITEAQALANAATSSDHGADDTDTHSDSDQRGSAQPRDQHSKLRTLLHVLEYHLCAFEDACDEFASALGSPDVEDSDEAKEQEISEYLELVTMLSEVEAVLNSRPLTYVGDDIEAVLPPSAFLCHRTTPALPPPSPDNSDDPEYVPNPTSAHDLVTLWAKGERLLNAFWQQWRNEYLAELRDRHQRLHQRGRAPTAAPAVGSIVLLADDAPRATWRLARIVDLQVSADGHIRSATVITADKRQLKRPLRLLYPLECEDVAPAAEAAPAAADTLAAAPAATPAAVTTPPPGRPQRAAAARQRQQLQQLINSDKLWRWLVCQHHG